jgi:hypothetical protein
MQHPKESLKRLFAALVLVLGPQLALAQTQDPVAQPVLTGAILELENGQDVSGTKVEFTALAAATAGSPPGGSPSTWTHMRLKSMKIEIDGTSVYSDTSGAGWVQVLENDPLAVSQITRRIRFMSNRFGDGQSIELKVTASMEVKEVTPEGTVGPVTVGPQSFAKTVYAYNKASLFQRTEFTTASGWVWWGGSNPPCTCPTGSFLHGHNSAYADGAEKASGPLAAMNHLVRGYRYDEYWPLEACLGYLGGSPVPAPPTVAYFNSHGGPYVMEAGDGGGLDATNVGAVIATRYAPPFNVAMLDACAVGAEPSLLEAFVSGSAVGRAAVGWTENVPINRTSQAMEAFWSSLGSGQTVEQAAVEAEIRYFGSSTPGIRRFEVVGDKFSTLGRVYTGTFSIPRTWALVLW